MKIIVFVIIVFLLISCSGRNEKRDENAIKVANISDSSLLFNGQTLDGWEISDFGPQGPVYVSSGKIILGMGDGCTGITFKRKFPEVNYVVSLEAMRANGNDFFCGMTFPVYDDHCTLIVGGWGGTVVGLSSIDGKDASENETTRYMKFEKERWYSIRLMVSDRKIEAWIDDEKVVDFIIGGKKLSIRPEVNLSRPFGITSWNTTAAIRNIRIERLLR